MNASLFLRVSSQLRPNFARNLNCWTAAITKKHQNVYVNTYPTILVLPDGSSMNIEYNIPRKIIVLPLNIAELSEEEQKLKIETRKPKTKVVLMDEIQDDFDEFKYVNMKKR
ncbi:PREDICTED: 39S ribosomal protein L55, mitochondrial [Polistes canadensis]|uniref:39S ribosomal protein L55, mitochondrial n=1 Tax=Polistes canadensis TaxID=91411 RepID=UPI000718E967|nr:PREDICTED: 39S ribosomal protein L55, mitochondrial [Polistes canadensis]